MYEGFVYVVTLRNALQVRRLSRDEPEKLWRAWQQARKQDELLVWADDAATEARQIVDLEIDPGEGAGVLVGAIVATGAPTLLPGWNTGYLGIGLSLLGAGFASAAAGFVLPELAASIAAGGVVVVGLRLVAQFVPRALRWAAPPPPAATAGYRGRHGGVAGYLPGPVARPTARGLPALIMRPNESFRSPRI